MIYDVLRILKKEIGNYLDDENLVVLENIAKAEDASDTSLNDKVIVTLLSTEEESTLKNTPRHEIKNGTKIYKSGAAYLNVYMMVAANRSTYEKSLQSISKVVEFFQDKSIFTNNNTDPSIFTLDDEDSQIEEFKFMVDLKSLRIEELSYAWTVLGGRTMPSALYKVSIVKVQRQKIKGVGPAITTIQETTLNLTENE
ncbi:hypothetical protein GCM10011344_28790 [Dokdonia pacifica]|uniref:Pvc16 N-terminal domain-containing protein n=1 Tax=Dokdonia pacifica TaxID=1627892 RepID=A0A239C802_9FLAO|nr:DUF4255 domain-containing protein [Dokdonia pacifica]GGG26329.1 hypothetical protein GCM10011344_28790 [Dokdonia pacifica]SNS16022.1 Protein of unknown function [Dokdonia pacifica]